MDLNETDISILSSNNTSDKQDMSSFMKNVTADFFKEGPIMESLNGTEIYYNTSNITLLEGDWRRTGKLAFDILLIFMLIVTMLSVGCEITWNNLFSHIKRPVSLFIGMLSQFVIMPLSAYCILLISGINGLQATGVLIISCCPAGLLSNVFTYFCDGDLPLSVAMTTASTIFAMGMMPLNIWLYGKHFETDTVVIPHVKMVLSLIAVTSAAVVGMLIRWKMPRVAKFTLKVGSYLTILLLIVSIVFEIVLFPNMFTNTPLKLYIIILLLPVAGLTLGYGLAFLLKRKTAVRLTIAIECGIQNCPLALTVMALSFPQEAQEEIVLIPWLYLFTMSTSCCIICVTYHLYNKIWKTNEEVKKREPLLVIPINVETNRQNVKNGSEIEMTGKLICNDESCI